MVGQTEKWCNVSRFLWTKKKCLSIVVFVWFSSHVKTVVYERRVS